MPVITSDDEILQRELDMLDSIAENVKGRHFILYFLFFIGSHSHSLAPREVKIEIFTSSLHHTIRECPELSWSQEDNHRI